MSMGFFALEPGFGRKHVYLPLDIITQLRDIQAVPLRHVRRGDPEGSPSPHYCYAAVILPGSMASARA